MIHKGKVGTVKRPSAKKGATLDSALQSQIEEFTSSVDIKTVPASPPEPGSHAWIKTGIITRRPQVRNKPVAEQDINSLASTARTAPNGRKFYDHPVNVYMDKGEIVLLNGEQRLKAAIKQSWEYINATFVEKPEEGERIIGQLVNNDRATSMDPIDYASAIENLISLDYSINKIASQMGVSEATIRKYRMLQDMPEYIADLSKLYLTVDVNAYTKLKQLHKLAEQTCRDLCNRFKERGVVSRKEIDDAIKQIKDNQTPSVTVEPGRYTIKKPSAQEISKQLKRLSVANPKAKVQFEHNGSRKVISGIRVENDESGNPSLIIEGIEPGE